MMMGTWRRVMRLRLIHERTEMIETIILSLVMVVLGFAIDILHRRLARIEEKLEKLMRLK